MISGKWIRHGLALACAVAVGGAAAASCITKDDYGHTQNGGSPLPGTTTSSVSGTFFPIDAETFSETFYGPFDWPFGFLLMFL